MSGPSQEMVEGHRRGSLAARTLEEVAALLGCTKSAVMQGEQRALQKLRRHPLIRQLAEECGIALED